MRGSSWAAVMGAAGLGFLAFALVISAQGSNQRAPQPFPATSPVEDIHSSSSGLRVVADGAGFSGLATIVSLHVVAEPGSELVGLAGAAVPEDAFTSESLPPTAGLLALPLPVGEPRGHVTWRLAPVSEPGPAVVEFGFIDVTLPEGGTRRIAGNWRLEVPTPADLAQRLQVETLVPNESKSDGGVTVRVEGAQRSASETLVTVAIGSDEVVTQLGQPHLRVNGERLEGAIVRTGDDGKVLQMAFPATPAGEPVVLVMGPFAQVPSGESGTVTVNLALSMARQGLTGALGQSGVVDRLTDISARSATAPEVLSYEFRRASRVGEDAHAIAFTLVGNYTDLEAVFALTDAGPLPIDLMESSHRRDANGVLTEGTTRVSFRLPAEIPETVVLGTDGRMEIIRGDWSIELVPE